MDEESIQFINQELLNGAHEIKLVFDFRNPPVTDDATAEELGIKELVSEQSTYFYGSSDGRIQNIRTASAQFHGLLIAPGETFSMVENIGEIDLDSGYAEALIIYGDRTIQGVGGGVCQVSTTLFRTVFFGGFPVVERYPHAYRVTYYEKTRANTINEQLAGLDATVYAPLIDFKFTNDTPHWMLMETYVDTPSRVLTWKFYSTSDGRSVDWSTTGLKNIVKPDYPIFEENEDLKKGKIEKVDWAVDGADVIVTRTVWRDGQILYDDEFKTEYQPWRAVCEYGPGTKKYPPPKNKQSRYSCQPQNN
jgi:vancomycin resistance protein YoaR